MELAIETIDLTKRYGSLTAVNKLDLKVERNVIHGFLGPNGAGKTTTIKVLVGLLKPDEGTVKVLGQEVRGDRSVELYAEPLSLVLLRAVTVALTYILAFLFISGMPSSEPKWLNSEKNARTK